MINPNELRVGNKVTMPFLGDVILDVIGIAVNSENKTFIQTENQKDNFFELPIKHQPIPLTEEWLVRFGFEKAITAFTYFWHYKKIRISQNDTFVGKDTFLCMLIGNNLGTNIQHVHQLQNLYFALAGEELTLNSNP